MRPISSLPHVKTQGRIQFFQLGCILYLSCMVRHQREILQGGGKGLGICCLLQAGIPAASMGQEFQQHLGQEFINGTGIPAASVGQEFINGTSGWDCSRAGAGKGHFSPFTPGFAPNLPKLCRVLSSCAAASFLNSFQIQMQIKFDGLSL